MEEKIESDVATGNIKGFIGIKGRKVRVPFDGGPCN